MVQSVSSHMDGDISSDCVAHSTVVNPRLTLYTLQHPSDNSMISDGMDAIAGLQQEPKILPPKYFYDDRGSDLFEQICDLPEYYVTRTESSILQACAAEIAQVTGPCELVELGSGSSTKTQLLFDAYCERLRPTENCPLHYIPIDVSGGMLSQSAHSLLHQYEALHVRGLVGTYAQALQNLPAAACPHRLLFFLGSSLGNLNHQECQTFMDQVCAALRPGDYFLLGIDLQKPVEVLEAAYNDAQGVTAAFNLNMLHHLNQRFGGDFQPDQFQHWAFYNTEHHRIEMHLRSKVQQTITLADLDFSVTLAPDETIRTEISRKFNLQQLPQILQGTVEQASELTLQPIQTWTDPNAWFGLILCQCQ